MNACLPAHACTVAFKRLPGNAGTGVSLTFIDKDKSTAAEIIKSVYM